MSWTTSTDSHLVRVLRESLEGLPFREVDLPPQPGSFAPILSSIDPRLVGKLNEQGIDQLFSHQREAVLASLRGEDVAISSGTSSGKTLCYALPILQTALEEPVSRALILYPTKALAQDQLGKLTALSPSPTIRTATFDGDTPKTQRSAIRNEAQIILSNPDMLHVGVLPNHANWRRALRALRWIVLDEIHTYRGSFGTHMAWVLRRLLRLCEWYGSRPGIIGCSATIPNIGPHFEALTGRVPKVIRDDSAPRGEKKLFLVEAPDDFAISRESPNQLSARLLSTLAFEDFRTLAFCRARVSTELVVRQARKRLTDRSGTPGWVDSYRGGYTAKERRTIEENLFRGRLRGLATTSAMEMGVDVGGLDAVIVNGYPGSLCSFWQQAGRAGRSGRFGAVVFIAHEDPLEQHLVRESSVLFQDSECASICMENTLICGAHMLCAADERAITEDELDRWPPVARAATTDHLESNALVVGGSRIFYPSHEPPARKVNLRGSGEEGIRLVADSEVIGEMERWRAMQWGFPGAVYLHRDKTFVVRSLDLESGLALLEEGEPGYYTQPIVQGFAEELLAIREAHKNDARFAFSSLELTTTTVGMRKLAQDGGKILSEEPVEMPPLQFQTLGVFLDIPDFMAPLTDENSAAAVHAVEHALASSAPLIAGCDPRDLGSVWFAMTPETMSPRIVIYDGMPGGLGFAESLYENLDNWLSAAQNLLASCPCAEGCPKCLLSPRCESSNELLDKQRGIALLRAISASV